MSRGNTRSDGRAGLTLENGLEALNASPEFRGPVEPLDGHESNDHLALIYESRAEQFAAAVPFVRQGLERGERCMYIADENTETEVVAAMRERGVDVDAALESGALTLHTRHDTYCRNGGFDPDEMISFLSDSIDEALEEYAGLRVAGEMAWILGDDHQVEDLIEYEGKLNRFFPETDCIALCQYNRERFPPEVIRDVIRTHPHLVYRNTVCQNFYYTPPEEFFGPDRPAHEIDRMMCTLLDRTEARAELQRRERYLREQNEITADAGGSFEEKLARLFELGCERFDLELGAMARIDRDTDRFEIEYVSREHDQFQPGFRLPLSETYCAAAAEEGVVSVSDPVAEGHEEITVHRNLGLEAYLGICIDVEGGPSRTFFFVSSEPQDTEFSDEELEFGRLMGQWVKYELERSHREADQRELYEIAADTTRSFDKKLDAVLELGCERFDLELGGVARIDPATDRFEVETVSADHDHLVPGRRVALSETYCRVFSDAGDGAGDDAATTSTDAPVDDTATACISDPVAEGYEDTRAYREFGVRAYLGTRIELDNDLDRTLFFVSTEPRTREFSEDERTFHRLMGQWLAYEFERKGREDRLAALNELNCRLMEAETPDEVSDRVLAAAADLGLPGLAIGLYDEREGVLRDGGRTDAAASLLCEASPLDVDDGVGWGAFVADEPRRTRLPPGDAGASPTDGTPSESAPPEETPIDDPSGTGGESDRATEIVALPLDRRGVLVAVSTEPGGFRSAAFDFVKTVAANVRAALDRAVRERELHEREQSLEEQNRALERLDRINGIIRNIDKSLVDASDRAEIEAVVCEQLAGVGPYEFAWIGEPGAEGAVTLREHAGTEKGYLDEVTVTADDGHTGNGPLGRAVETREPQVVDNVLSDASFEPWRQAALNRGFHSALALPLVYDDSMYGVLVVYASQPGVFDGLAEAVLSELSDTIAFAINAAESKKALVGAQITELEFRIEGGLSLLDLSVETGCDVRHETCILRTDGTFSVFFSTSGAPAADVLDAAAGLDADEVTLLSEYEADDETVALFEASPTGEGICRTVLEHGGVLDGLTATDGAATARVELPSDANVREFVEMFRTKYPSSELLAQRTRERERESLTAFSAHLREELTERQLEVLQTAYYSGYFETPRPRNGSEIAESLGVTQPTFTHHLRVGHRKLCRLLFEEGYFRNVSG